MSRSKGTIYSATMRWGHVWLGKKKDTGIWVARYKLPHNGRIRERSTKSTLKEDAIRQAEALSADISKGEAGVADGSVPLEHLFSLYFTAKALVCKASTLKRVQSSVKAVKRWIEATREPVRKAGDLTPPRLREFQRFRVDSEACKPRTVDDDIVSVAPDPSGGVRRSWVTL